MKTLITMTAVAFTMFATAASALTIPSGHVISSDGAVIPAHQSPSAQAEADRAGYAVVGSVVVLAVTDDVYVSIPVSALVNTTRQQIGVIVGQHIAAQLSDEELAIIADLAGDTAARLGEDVAGDLAADIAADLASGRGNLSQLEEFQRIVEGVQNGTHSQADIDAFHDRNPGLAGN